jgi:tetratricopeptide (TPR) repeat protein/tRNA A-37 threonylcarbamoyl transferase component Bud32
LTDLQDRLSAALAGRYVLDRELGRGGMATVYLARDLKHDRKVALKVLHPELAATLGPERFEREVRTTARLQHPHILPVLDSGEAVGQLWYTMPYVRGESLRERLLREPQLSIEAALDLARQVASALDYAHREGVVHRDLKPENILLTDGQALVADFGVAKALQEGVGEKLTGTGFAVGTPAYMSPEQAAGGGELDGRSDLYSLGCVLYEMLAGEPPFTGRTPQALIGKRLVDDAPPVWRLRPAVPHSLDRTLSKALARAPADRFATIGDFAAALQAETHDERRQLPLLSVLALYTVAAIAVLGVVRLLSNGLGLPDWVTPGALVLLVLGLPIIVATAVLQGRHTTRALSNNSIHGWLTWRRSLWGGALAFTGLGVATAGYMALRVLGIGPVGTLLASGVLKERERMLLAGFQNRTRDTLLSAAVSDAFRIDFAQSPLVTLVPPERVVEVLKRMRRPAAAWLDPALAREVAARDGIRVIVTGGIATAGSGYLLSAELVSAVSGEVLAGHRETAKDSTKIIPAIDRLSSRLRGRIGESFKSLRGEPSLEQVTTSSLEALRKYTQAVRAGDFGGDHAKAVTLLEEAVALDTGFATAYRTLGVYLGILGERERQIKAHTKAFLHGDRGSTRERDHTRAWYYSEVTYELDKAASVYRAILESYPEDSLALGNLGILYVEFRQPARAEELFRRLIALNSGAANPYLNLTGAQVALGRRPEAEQTFERVAKRFPDNPTVKWWGIELASSGGDYRTAEARARALRERHGESAAYRAIASQELADLATVRGRLAEAKRHWRDAMDAYAEAANAAAYLRAAVSLGLLDVWLRREPTRALKEVERALAQYRLDSLKPLDRPYLWLAVAYASVGKPQQARVLLAEYERAVEPVLRRSEEPSRRRAWGYVAAAEGRHVDALAEFRSYAAGAGGWCAICGLPELGRAYDHAGKADSAVAIYERYVRTPSLWLRLSTDAPVLAGIYKRLGELYEARGEREKARNYYSHFIELWKQCDPELGPRVAEARRRLISLNGESGQ